MDQSKLAPALSTPGTGKAQMNRLLSSYRQGTHKQGSIWSAAKEPVFPLLPAGFQRGPQRTRFWCVGVERKQVLRFAQDDAVYSSEDTTSLCRSSVFSASCVSSVGKFLSLCVCLVLTANLASAATLQSARIKDLASIEGIRDNPLIGYGLVVGLKGTGDSQQTVFSTQTLANMLQRMGVQVNAANVMVKNIAAVFVTAELPPFARPGMQIDVNVSSVGDAKSIEGGLLLMTRLFAANGQVYAAAQGPVAVGGYSAGVPGNTRTVNQPTAGRIPGGATVEQAAPLELRNLHSVALLLRDADFATARDLAAAINDEFKVEIAHAVDSRRVEVDTPQGTADALPTMLARIEELVVPVHPAARVVVNERTGTIVIGREVRLSPVSILHGNLVIDVATTYQVSQPAPLAKVGQTEVVPQTKVSAVETPTHRMELPEGATVEDLVRGLQTIGATARDVVSILQAMQKAGALQAELDII